MSLKLRLALILSSVITTTFISLALAACGGSPTAPEPSKPTVGTEPPETVQNPGHDPTKDPPPDPCAFCSQGQTCNAGKCETPVNPAACDGIDPIKGEWTSQYGDAMVETKATANGCAVSISGQGAIIRTSPDTPIMATKLPIILEADDGNSQEIKLEDALLKMSYTDPGQRPVERAYTRKQ